MAPVAGPGRGVFTFDTHINKACRVACTVYYCIGIEFRLEVELLFNISK